MAKICLVVCLVAGMVACASNPKALPPAAKRPDVRMLAHVLNRIGFGPRPGDVQRVQAMGLKAYVDEQLAPERIADPAVEAQLAALPALVVTPKSFAAEYYLPMLAARQQYTAASRPAAAAGGSSLPVLRGRLLQVAATTLAAADRPVAVIQQGTATQEEVVYQRENQQVFDALQARKILRAVYSERQLQEVLTDFWFNHFNVDARKLEDKPVVLEYETDTIRPRVLGRFRDLLGATAKSPAMLFYLDNWLSAAPPPPRPGVAAPAQAAPGRGLNENYGRELMELHTLGVDGGYTQQDVIDVARCFTGWTMRKPREATGFEFNDRMHDHGEKHVLGHTIAAGHGIEDGEQVLDILAHHPSTAHFIATKLVRRFVADDPPPALVERAAKTFQETDGDLREVMRTILMSPEFFSAAVYRAKVKTPLEFVVSALRATGASITNARVFVGTVSSLGEPLYLCQPPTGYGDVASIWIGTGSLLGRLNFANALTANGAGGAKFEATRTAAAISQFGEDVLANDLAEPTRAAMLRTTTPIQVRLALLVGSPEFQRR